MGLFLALSFLAGCGGGGSATPDIATERKNAMKMSDPVARSRKLVAVADKQRKVGDVLGAKETLVAATDAAEQITEAGSQAGSYVQIAGSILRGGDLGAGKDMLKKVEKIAAEIPDAGVKASIYADLAGVYREQSPDKASYWLKQARETAAQVANPEQKGIALARIGEATIRAELTDDAKQIVAELAELARSLEDLRKRSDALTDAAVLAGKVEPELATTLLTEADEAAAGTEDAYTRSHAYLSMANKLAKAGKKSDAAPRAAKASDLADKVGDSTLRIELVEQINKLRNTL